jgi:hypothetical protein
MAGQDMIYLILYIFLWTIAGFLNAVMDAIDLHPLTNNLPRTKFFRMSMAGWKFDAWHLSKWFILLFFVIAGGCLYLVDDMDLFFIGGTATAGGLLFGICHDLFFDKIFLKKDIENQNEFI